MPDATRCLLRFVVQSFPCWRINHLPSDVHFLHMKAFTKYLPSLMSDIWLTPCWKSMKIAQIRNVFEFVRRIMPANPPLAERNQLSTCPVPLPLAGRVREGVNQRTCTTTKPSATSPARFATNRHRPRNASGTSSAHKTLWPQIPPSGRDRQLHCRLCLLRNQTHRRTRWSATFRVRSC